MRSPWNQSLVRASLLAILAIFPLTAHADDCPAGEELDEDGITCVAKKEENKTAALTEADCAKEGKALYEGACVAKKIDENQTVAKTEADCAALGQVLGSDGNCAAKPAPARKPVTLTLDEAKAAFGSEFSAKKLDDGKIVLYGGTSEECMKTFACSVDAMKGTFTITYDRSNDACKTYSKAVEAIGEDGNFQGLNGLAECQMTPKGDFEKVELAWENKFSTLEPKKSLEIPTVDGKSIANESETKVAERKKKEADDKQAYDAERDVLLATKCIKGFKELDVGDAALARLMGLPEAVKTELATAKDLDFDEKLKDRQAAMFKACKNEILKAKMDETKVANCETRLQKLVDEDEETYLSKAKDLYLSLATRILNAYVNGTTEMSLTESYDAAIDAIEKARGLLEEEDLTEEQKKAFYAAERNINLQFLRLAAMKGEKSEEFIAMKQNMADFLLAGDSVDEKKACFVGDDVTINPAAARSSACADKFWLRQQLEQYTVLARGNQAMIEKQAQAAADAQACSLARASGQTLGAADEAKCKAIETAAANQASAAANGGLTAAANGFGEVTNAETAKAKDSGASGFMNSGYTAPANNTATKTETKAVTPPTTNTPVNVTVNSAPTRRRLGH